MAIHPFRREVYYGARLLTWSSIKGIPFLNGFPKNGGFMAMSERQIKMRDKLKRLGYGQNCQIRLYGDNFDVTGDPVVMSENLVFIDAIEQKSGQARRIRIPLSVLNIANHEKKSA